MQNILYSATAQAQVIKQKNISSNAIDISQNWKNKFGACLNIEDGNYTQKIRDFTQIAKLKYLIQLQNINSLDAGSTYARYLNAVVRLTPLAEALQKLRILDTDKYFENLFRDKRFQDFASSQNFSILNIFTQDEFFNTRKNKDPRFLKLLTKLQLDDPQYFDLRATWSKAQELLKSKSLIESLQTLSHVDDKYRIDTSIIDPDLAAQLIEFGTKIANGQNFETFYVNQNSLLVDLNFPTQMKRNADGYLNNYAKIASQIIKERIERSYVVDKSIYFNKDHVVIERKITTDDLINFKNGKYSKYLETIRQQLLTENKIQNNDQSFVDYLNDIERPSRFAFDEFIIKNYWQLDENRKSYLLKSNQKNYTASPQQMAAIDGLARSLVGEAMSCQEGGSAQYEAIGLVFANRALAIEHYFKQQKIVEDHRNDTHMFQKQLEVLYSPNINAQFERYSSNPLRGLADFGRRDTYGTLLHPISQALSAPRQFDSWQAAQTESFSLEQLLGQQPQNIPYLNLDIPKKLNFGEAPVYNTVLCPRGKSTDALKNTKSIMFDKALDVAAEVVLNQTNFLKRYSFLNDKSKSSIPEVYFYTHGVKLGFALQSPTSYLKDSLTGNILPLKKAKAGACAQFMLFKATPANKYLIKNE